ncbi:bcl-2-binding component 3 [Anableps anableps]
MARAETIETVGENEGGRNGPLSCLNTCRMELPQPLHTRPSLLTTRTSDSAFHLQNSPHHMEPLQAIYMSNQLPYSHPEGQDEAQSHQQSPALPPSLTPSCCPVRDESSRRTVSPSDSSEEQPGSNREEHQDASIWQGPLPDLLPQNEHSSWASPPHQRGLGGEATQQMDVRRVARQLRMIGDEFNAIVLHRVHVAAQWQDWRDVCRGFLNFIAQTLSTLYRLT